MAPSFDCVSSLLCAEDSNSVFDDNHYGGTVVEVYEETWHRTRYHQSHHFGEPDWLPLLGDECFAMMVEKEWQQWHGVDYFNRLQSGDLDFGARNEAIEWIEKVCSTL